MAPGSVFQILRIAKGARPPVLTAFQRILGNHQKTMSALPRALCTVRNYSSTASKEEPAPSAGDAENASLLSKLFPQTAPEMNKTEEQERQKREEEETKENERAWKRMKLGFAVFGGGGIVGGLWALYEFGKPDVDPNGLTIEDEFTHKPMVQQYFQRMWKSLHYYQKMIQEPSRDKLLPDPLQHPYIQPKYTLVLEMKDVLVHPDWTYQTGWRFKKRPGVDHFLSELAKEFEIVVFTAEQGMTVFPILDALDPHGYIMYRLVRDATHFVDGHHVKNLNNLNRDLRKVIVVDWDHNATKMHPDNTFGIARWNGNDDDTQLLDLVAFLKIIAQNDVEDVRETLHYYRQFEDPISQFRENQRKLAEQMQEEERIERAKAKPMVKQWTRNLLGR
ncbi:mitochondrial import inner membrane translocase subunit TIM50-C [Drosophila miranda]|uniref:mitochondrial import inner membrane translocase subunit TIM50-C n=1 Tax=Drosophila miranda TaxID=7229 RepID=UPI0007E68A83|nr:mitochondrial import inner membrane translocase subunit TIM50-C [Drosophila miranda]